MIKTYGVFGLMELTINVTLGKRVMQIPFTGGMASARGITPATYTTGNAIVQYAIEHSADYACGRVKLTKTIDVGNATASQPAKVAVETKVVAVTSLAEAKDYLVANYGISASALRTKKNIEDQAAAKGVKFEGI